MVRVTLLVGLHVSDPRGSRLLSARKAAAIGLLSISPFLSGPAWTSPSSPCYCGVPDDWWERGTTSFWEHGRQGYDLDCVWPLVLMRLVPSDPEFWFPHL